MIFAILLLASNLQSGNLWAQSATQPVAPEDKQPTDQQVNNTNLPGKNIVGILLQNKTSEQVRRLMSGKPTITGVPTFQGGIVFSNTSGNALTFQDATTMNTAAATLSGNNTWTGYNLHKSTTNFSTAVELGPTTVGAGSYRAPITMLAKSIDGVTQSSGCVVSLAVDASNNLVITSTTTDFSSSGGGMATVLYEDSCAPGAQCHFVVDGMVLANTVATGSAFNQLTTSTTRCKGYGVASATCNFCVGRFLKAPIAGATPIIISY